jgi:hypothetical protein
MTSSRHASLAFPRPMVFSHVDNGRRTQTAPAAAAAPVPQPVFSQPGR